jgi:hypothetical protein
MVSARIGDCQGWVGRGWDAGAGAPSSAALKAAATYGSRKRCERCIRATLLRNAVLAPACLFWYQLIMVKSIITGISKKKRGRPALYEGSEGKGAPQIGLRLPPPELAAVDGWIAKQPKPRPSRPVAIRRLVELGLKAKAK